MHKHQFFLPESMYEMDPKMNLKKLYWYFENYSAVTGKVIRLNNKKKYLEVDLGKNFRGRLPFEESTIYPIYNLDGTLSANVYSLVGKKIQVQITKIERFHKVILLSRKQNMEYVLENIQDNTEFDYVKITSYTQRSAFVDVGAGIVGRIYSSSFSSIHFNDINELEIPVGTTISTKVTNYNSVKKRFDLSRIILNPEDVLCPGERVIVKIFDPVINDPDEIGYYCLIESQIKGIIDSPDCQLNYGDHVLALIKNISSNKVHLNYIQKLR